MGATYTPVYTAATERAYAGRDVTDPLAYTSYNAAVVAAKYFGQETTNEILALWRAAVAAKEYQLTYTCLAGLNVGDPVYLSAASTATLALATTAATARVIGFCAYKPTATTCCIDHYRYVTGLSGLTVNNPVYLTNAGAFSATAGTIPKTVGIAVTTTTALLRASQVTTHETGSPFPHQTFFIYNPANTFKVGFEMGAEVADRTLTFPLMGGARTVPYLERANTWTALQTMEVAAGTHFYFNNASGISFRNETHYRASGVTRYQVGTDFGDNNTRNFYFYDAIGGTAFVLSSNGNLLLSKSGLVEAGTSGVGNIGLASGTAPTTSPADYAAMWVADIGAANAGLFIRGEGVAAGAGYSWAFGGLVGAATYSAIYAANDTPSATNYLLVHGSGDPNTYWNCASGGANHFRVAGSTYFHANAGGINVGQTAAPATGSNILKIESGAAWTSVADAVALRSADSAATKANLWAQNEAAVLKQLTGLDARRTNTQTVTDTVTLAADNTLVIDVVAGEKYEFVLRYVFTTVNTSGVSVDLGGGSCTFTSFSGWGEINSLSAGTFLSAVEMTAATTLVGFTATGTVASVLIRGAFVANAAGTFAPRFAQNAETGAAESVIAKANSTLILTHIGA